MSGRVSKKGIVGILTIVVLVLVFVFNTRTTITGTFHNGLQKRFPQAIIIGVKKGGTKALLTMLNSHPDVVTARGEVHFFDRNESFEQGVDWYIDRMPLSTARQTTVEKSPSYFITPYVPRRIHQVSPNLKLLLIVRNPIERALSDYLQLFNPQRKEKSLLFDEVILDDDEHINEKVQIIRVSCYDLHVMHWLDHFPIEQIHLIDGDVLITDPVTEIVKVEKFLGISHFFQKDMFYYNSSKGFYCWHKATHNGDTHPNCLGKGKGHTHPTIPQKTRELLKDFFHAHNEKFFKLVGKEFTWN